MPSKRSGNYKKGKPGGGGDGGNGIISGTEGNDVLRGGRGDDIFQSFGGTDVIHGRTGYDVLIVDGSVWDYDWHQWGGEWQLEERGNPQNEVTLYDVEEIRFSDYTVVLGEEIPLEVLEAPPERLVVEAGGEASFDFMLRDMDDFIDVTIETPSELAYGSIWLETVPDEGIYGANGQQRAYTFNYDYDRYYQDFTDGPVEELAEGEEYVLPVTLKIKTSNFWLDADDPDRGEFHELTFDLVIVGKNEAPTIAGHGVVEAIEGGGEVRFDLSQFGDDIDSDDDGGTLSYEIVSSVGGLDVRIEGSELVLSADTLADITTSDEFATGTVELRAVDRHGAVSTQTVSVDLTVRGTDNTVLPPDYLLADGSIDYDALGVTGAPVLDFGTQIVSGWGIDLPTALDLLDFGAGDDLRVIKAGSLVNFWEGGNLVEGDEVLLDDISFQMGAGNDRYVLQAQSTGQSYLSFVDIFGAEGEDVVAISLNGGTEAAFHGGMIDTGAQSDRVLIDMEYGYKGWLTGDIDTGSGHDLVDIRMSSNTATSGTLGEVLMTSDIDLGTGDDRLTLVADAGGLNALQKVDFTVSAGEGDDHLTIDLSGLGTAATISETQDPNGIFSELYPGGFDGSISLGDGNDLLELTLAQAANAVTASIYAQDYGDDDDFDVVMLHHLSPGTASVESFDSLYGEAVRIVDGHQTLELFGFDQILLDDGTNLLA